MTTKGEKHVLGTGHPCQEHNIDGTDYRTFPVPRQRLAALGLLEMMFVATGSSDMVSESRHVLASHGTNNTEVTGSLDIATTIGTWERQSAVMETRNGLETGRRGETQHTPVQKTQRRFLVMNWCM